jgi:hypothetical protein
MGSQGLPCRATVRHLVIVESDLQGAKAVCLKRQAAGCSGYSPTPAVQLSVKEQGLAN